MNDSDYLGKILVFMDNFSRKLSLDLNIINLFRVETILNIF